MVCHPLAPFLLVAPVARSACRQVSELCECCACVCSLGMRLRALDARAAVECVAGVMASAIELEIQERRVKKARLDVETPALPLDEVSDPNLTPLPLHPGIKYVARSPCCDLVEISNHLLAICLIHR